jgi:5-methylcytosine-specific restriction endonuclease McrA
MSDTGFPRFKRATVAPYKPRVGPPGLHRGSSRERGYDRAWDQFSVAWRRQNPFCAMCEQNGRDVVCDVVDHMIPLVDGGERLAPENVWSLCHLCHSRTKAEWERYARARGLIEMLPEWCRNPGSRPRKFRTT